MRLCAFALLLIAAVPAAAWAAQDPEEAPWTLTLELSGGPAALDREIVLTNTGMVTATDRIGKTTVSEQLSPDDTQALTRLARGYSPNDLTSATCTNCVTYVLDIDAAGRKYSISMTERQLASSGAETLVRALTRVLTRMLSQRP